MRTEARSIHQSGGRYAWRIRSPGARLLERDGFLVDDFRIVRTKKMVHVLNAPSPAATACLSIGLTIGGIVLDG